MATSKEIVVVIPQQGFPGGPLLSLRAAILEHAGDVLRVVAPERGTCRGTGGVHATAESALDEIHASSVAAMVVIDGPDQWLTHEPAMERLLQEIDRAGRVICAVGHGVATLAVAGILRGHEVAAEDELGETVRDFGGVAVAEPLVSSGNIVTATEQGAARLAVELFGFRHHVEAPTHP